MAENDGKLGCYILQDPKKPLLGDCRRISRAQLSYLLEKIYAVAAEPQLRVWLTSILHPWSGVFFSHTVTRNNGFYAILINPRAALLPTFIHEVLHILFAESEEREVYAMEKQMAGMMGFRQWGKLHRALSHALDRTPTRPPSYLLRTFFDEDGALEKELMKAQAKEARKNGEREWLKEFFNP